MSGMLGIMNAARLGVGIQGIGIGEVAYQNGYAYAHERRVGRALTGPKEPDKPADLEMQCDGGHGYIRDNGVEQFVRDARINQIYEGANAVQAMDLVGRKLGKGGGVAPMALFGVLTGWISANEADDAMKPFVAGVKRGTETLQAATLWLAANGPKNPNDAGAGATEYLRLMGITVVALMWGMMAKASLGLVVLLFLVLLSCVCFWLVCLVPVAPL